jgi:hypothetical protein
MPVPGHGGMTGAVPVWGGRYAGGVSALPPEPVAASDMLAVVLLGMAALLCCMPYIVFGPIAAPSQVQPWAALLGWAFLVQRLLARALRVSRFQLLMLGFALWFLLYVQAPGEVSLDYYLRKSASFLICWSLLVAMPYLSPALAWRALKVALPLWTAFGVLGLVSKGLYLAVTRSLVPTASGMLGGRGVTSLAPEATDYGFTMAFLLLLALIVRRVLQSHRAAPVEWWPVALAGVNVLLSQSGSGFFAAIVIVGVLYLTAGGGGVHPAIRYLVAITTLLSVLLVIGAMPDTNVRGIDLLLLTLRDPHALLNTTMSYRIAHNAVGILGLLDSHLAGYGAGTFLKKGGDLYVQYQLGRTFGLTGYYATSVAMSFQGSPVAYFPVLFLEYGLVGLIYVLILFRAVGLSRMPYVAVALAMMFMTWVQSFPAAYPPFWMLVGLAFNPRFQMPRHPVETAHG